MEIFLAVVILLLVFCFLLSLAGERITPGAYRGLIPNMLEGLRVLGFMLVTLLVVSLVCLVIGWAILVVGGALA